MDRQQPGRIRDAIVEFMNRCDDAVSVAEIEAVVTRKLGEVPRSSVRSYLGLNTPDMFIRTERGFYQMKNPPADSHQLKRKTQAAFQYKQSILYNDDCLQWLKTIPPRSIHAVVTDPPYGLVEYSEKEKTKLRNGNGGVWRIPPSFDGSKRSPLPRFTTLSSADISAIGKFFEALGLLLYRVTVPGANIILASNPLVFHYAAHSLARSGLEPRGSIIRLVMTMRGGDRPKNAHDKYPHVSVMPRSMWEPWLIFRRPLEGRVQDNLARWGTGGFRRPSSDRPFGDVIKSGPTRSSERRHAPHPSLKPQEFLREIIRGVLPMESGTILDPFAGSGSTLAAASAVGRDCIGVEKDFEYFTMAKTAIPALASL